MPRLTRSSFTLAVIAALASASLATSAYAQTSVTSDTAQAASAAPLTATVAMKPVVKVGRPLKVSVSMASATESMTPEAVLEVQKYDIKSGKWGETWFRKLSLPVTSASVTTQSMITFSKRGPRRIRLRYRGLPSDAFSMTPWIQVTACGSKVIALTLDDGPDTRDTPIALKALKRYQARATFFMLGNRVAKSPKLVRQMSQAGHQLGNHTWRHVPATSLSAARFSKSVLSTNRAINRALEASPSVAWTRRYPIAFRYPWGNGNKTTAQVLRANGIRNYGWDYATGDGGSHGPKSKYVTDLIARKVISNARPGQIILMHDGQDRPNSVAALPRILRTLSERGYDFVTVSDLRTLRDN